MKRIKTYWSRIIGIVLAAGLCLGFMAGCGDVQTYEDDGPTRIYRDSLGREVEIPENITRVIPSGTLAQIFLYAVAPDSLIAISGAWSDDAEAYVDGKYLELPDVGQFFGAQDLNYEEIAKMNPQIIVDVGERKDTLEEDLQTITEKTGIPAVHIDAELETLDETFLALGELLGQEEQGAALAEYCASRYQKALEVMAKVDEDGARKSLLYCTGENGLNVVARNSYHSAIIDLLSDNKAVLKNPSSKGSGNETDMEQLLNWDPEVIVFAPDSYYEYAADDRTWESLQAVKNGTFYEVPIGPYNWMGFPPSSNRVMGMVWLTQLLYPEYAQYDMEMETKTYYELFYHSELTTDQYEKLVEHSILKQQGE